MKTLYWLITVVSFVIAATSLVALVVLAGGGLWSIILAGAIGGAMMAVPAFRRPHDARHGPSSSLIEHLSARAPEALERADVQALLGMALEYAAASLPATDILLLEMADGDAIVRLARGHVQVYVDKRFRVAEPVTAHFNEDPVLALPDLRELDSGDESEGFPAVLVGLGLRAILMARICKTGILVFVSTQRNAFSADDRSFLAGVAAQLDYICATQQRALTAETQLEERAGLMGFIDELAERHEASPVIEEMLIWAVKFLSATTGSIMVIDHHRGELDPVASVGLDEQERLAPIKIGEGVAGWVAKSKKPIIVEEIPDAGYSANFPVFVQGEVWAVVSLVFQAGSPRFDRKALDKVRLTVERIMSLTEPFSYALDVRSTHVATIAALVELSESRNRWRRGHAARVRDLAAAAGRALLLDHEDRGFLEVASLLYAFGYLTVDPDLLTAVRPLDRRELAEIRRHAAITADYLSMAPEMDDIIPIVRHYQEHWDGSGENGLEGDQIPLGARILAVVDAYVAMISPRPYRPAMSRDQAVRELNRQAGIDFDPRVVGAVTEIVSL